MMCSGSGGGGRRRNGNQFRLFPCHSVQAGRRGERLKLARPAVSPRQSVVRVGVSGVSGEQRPGGDSGKSSNTDADRTPTAGLFEEALRQTIAECDRCLHCTMT